MAQERRTIDIVLDSTAPTAEVERAVLEVQNLRAKLAQAEERLSALIGNSGGGRIKVDGSADPTPEPQRRVARRPRLPKGKNLKALQAIASAGGIDAGALAKILYGKIGREERLKTYSKLRHWKSNGWLIKNDAGEWVVRPGFLEEVAAQES